MFFSSCVNGRKGRQLQNVSSRHASWHDIQRGVRLGQLDCFHQARNTCRIRGVVEGYSKIGDPVDVVSYDLNQTPGLIGGWHCIGQCDGVK